MNSHRFFSATAAFIQGTTWVAARALLFLFVRFSVQGKEHLAPLNGKAIIFASNHANEVDALLMRYALPLFSPWTPLFYPVREAPFYRNDHETFSWRRFIYGGTIFKLLGAFPIRSGRQNYAEALQEYVVLLEEKRSVCIFPEGRMTTTGAMGEAHGGVAYLAGKTGAAVVPVRIEGTYRLTAARFIFSRPSIRIRIGAPMYLTLPRDTTDGSALALHCKKQAAQVLDRIKEM